MAGLFEEKCCVISNRLVGPRLYVMTLYSPRTAAAIKPGQFVHLGITTNPSQILRRPFSVFTTDEARGEISILYQVVGVGTQEMSEWSAGINSTLIAPIGRGWRPQEGVQKALLVGGGVGAAPLFMLCRMLCQNGAEVDVALGAATASAQVCLPAYGDLGMERLRVLPATDDGTLGIKGFCTAIAQEALLGARDAGSPYDYIATCGPEPMMRIVATLAEDAGVFCEVSLERRMACGIGACLSCVVDTKSGKLRACVDGPVFNAQELIW